MRLHRLHSPTLISSAALFREMSKPTRHTCIIDHRDSVGRSGLRQQCTRLTSCVLLSYRIVDTSSVGRLLVWCTAWMKGWEMSPAACRLRACGVLTSQLSSCSQTRTAHLRMPVRRLGATICPIVEVRSSTYELDNHQFLNQLDKHWQKQCISGRLCVIVFHRAGKCSIWEGGTKGVSIVASPLLTKTNIAYHGLAHAVDWLPTLIVGALSGSTASTKPLDGHDLWAALLSNDPSKSTRTDI